MLLIIFFLNLLFASALRDDFFSSLRQSVGVILSFVVVLFLSSLLQSLSIQRALFIFALSIFVTLLVSTYIHLTTSGVLAFFDHEFRSRLGGLFFTAHFAMLAGLSGLLSLIGMLDFNFRDYRIFYVINLYQSLRLLKQSLRASRISRVHPSSP